MPSVEKKRFKKIRNHQIKILKRLWRHLSHRRHVQFYLLFLLMILVSFAEVISIGLIGPFLGVISTPDRLFVVSYVQPIVHFFQLTEARQLLPVLVVAFILATLFAGLMRLLLLFAQNKISYGVGADLGIDIYRRTLFQPYSIHVMRNTSEVISGIWSKSNNVVHSTLFPVITILSSSMMVIGIVIFMMMIEPMITSIAFLGFGLIYLFAVVATKGRLSRDSKSVSQEVTAIHKALQEGLGGIRDILIDGSQDLHCNIYQQADIRLRKSQISVQIIGGSPRFIIEALGMILIAILAVVLAGDDGGLTNAMPTLGVLALGAQRMLPMLQNSYQSWTLIRSGDASLRDTLVLLDQPLPKYALKTTAKKLLFENSIALKKVSFRYLAGAPLVLKDISLSIKKGDRVGIIGSTGSGKSTLLDLIMALLFPTEGEVLIDGVPLSNLNTQEWQRNIAHVPQMIFLADSTVEENIAFGVSPEKIDRDLVKLAAKQANIYDVIEGWSDGFLTQIGEKGVRLSGGQRQRIGIARALYKKSNVLILDEATSSLDGETESSVMDSIRNLPEGLTLLIVAHRLSTLKICNSIIQIENGVIKSTGSFSSVIGDR